MEVNTTRFGRVEVEDSLVLTFPRGLYGLEEYTQYCLLSQDPSNPFRWLQSVHEPDLALVVASPFGFFPGYDIDVDDSELVEVSNGLQALPEVLCVVTIAGMVRRISMNLRAPILVFDGTKRGRQVILSDLRYDIRTEIPVGARKGQEVGTGAGTDSKGK